MSKKKVDPIQKQTPVALFPEQTIKRKVADRPQYQTRRLSHPDKIPKKPKILGT
jgi:hypothetical protein